MANKHTKYSLRAKPTLQNHVKQLDLVQILRCSKVAYYGIAYQMFIQGGHLKSNVKFQYIQVYFPVHFSVFKSFT